MAPLLISIIGVVVVCGLVILQARKGYAGVGAIAFIFVIAGSILSAAVLTLSTAVQTADTEIVNGQVTSKTRDHGTYEESYECNCRTIEVGDTKRTTCDTCHRTHYTVKWACQTTIGEFRIESLDSTSNLVYLTPDPARYLEIREGDPAARERLYVNYIQAVPESLFAVNSATNKRQFASLLPAYPRVFDIYKVNRFLTPGLDVKDAREWNESISLGLRELGPLKQVNLIFVVANTADAGYVDALQEHWEGVNKNDVVVVIGSTSYPKIEFVRILSWTKSEKFKVELRDALEGRPQVDREMVHIALDHIDRNFVRRRMREFEYLKDEITPPVWLVAMVLGGLVAAAGVTAFFVPRLGKFVTKR